MASGTVRKYGIGKGVPVTRLVRLATWVCLALLHAESGGLSAQPVCGYPIEPGKRFNRVRAKADGWTDAEIDAYLARFRTKEEYERCSDSVIKATDGDAVIAAVISRTIEKARQDSLSLEKARHDSAQRIADAQQKRDEDRRERLGRWLWAVPLSVFALVVLVAVRGEPVKAWIGRLHGGQVFILASSLLVGGLLSLVAALLIDSIPAAWITGFVPVGAVSAVLVLWFWFGARAKPKGDA